MTINLELYRKLANSYLIDNDRQNEIYDFVDSSDSIWDATLSTYDLLAPSKRGDDIKITDINSNVVDSRGVFNYNKEYTRVNLKEGQIRCFLQKDSAQVGTYVKRVSDNKDYLVEYINQDKHLFIDGFLRECNSSANYIDKDGSIRSFPCVYKISSLTDKDTSENKYIEVKSGDAWIKLQNNQYTSQLSSLDNNRLIFSRDECYSIKNVYTQLESGLVFIKLEQSEINPDTDKYVDLGNGIFGWIANYEDRDIFEVIIDQDDSEVVNGNTLQLSAQITKNGQEYDGTVTWSSDDELIATVDSNGLVTTIANGIANITATLDGNDNVTDSVQITVASSVVDNFSYEVTPNVDGILLGDTIVINVQGYNNGSPIVETYTFSVDPSTTANSSDYAFEVIDSDSFKITNDNNNGNVVIKIIPNGNVGAEFTKSYILKYFY